MQDEIMKAINANFQKINIPGADNKAIKGTKIFMSAPPRALNKKQSIKRDMAIIFNVPILLKYIPGTQQKAMK